MYNIVRIASSRANQVGYQRTTYSVLASAMAELGELAEEVAIANNHSYKSEGPDGVLGEAVDVIVSLFDLLYLQYPDLTQEELEQVIKSKTNKWLYKLSEHCESG